MPCLYGSTHGLNKPPRTTLLLSPLEPNTTATLGLIGSSLRSPITIIFASGFFETMESIFSLQTLAAFERPGALASSPPLREGQ